MYMKHWKVLIEPIAETKDKKKVLKRDKKVVHVEREEETDLDVQVSVTRRWCKQTGDEMLLPKRSY